jgi:hypothetical protein
MAPLMRELPESADPSKPLRPGTVSQIAGRPVHVWCLARQLALRAIEQQDRASRETERATAAIQQTNELVNTVRRKTMHCPACGEPVALSRSVARASAATG